jgi:hypothetical protein
MTSSGERQGCTTQDEQDARGHFPGGWATCESKVARGDGKIGHRAGMAPDVQLIRAGLGRVKSVVALIARSGLAHDE